jgi:Mce-associated membrane protein
VARILDSATGTFHDDFQKRSQPFIQVVKQAQSKTEGTVTAAGLESVNGDSAQVLVAVSVKTTNAGAPEQQPHAWRMRIDVQKVNDGVKVSNVGFVS